MSADLLITFNAGSSTVKIGVFETDMARPRRLATGTLDFRRVPASLHVTKGQTTFDIDLKAEPSDIVSIVAEAFGFLAQHFDVNRVAAVGHRVVHGGDAFGGPVRIDDATTEAIDKLTLLAPLHQPHSLRLIRAVRQLRPNLACALTHRE
jgi:acetate kinase